MIHGKHHCKPHGLLITPLALAHACCNARHSVFHMLDHALPIFQPWQGPPGSIEPPYDSTYKRHEEDTRHAYSHAFIFILSYTVFPRVSGPR
jgi:hypothetical protein